MTPKTIMERLSSNELREADMNLDEQTLRREEAELDRLKRRRDG